MLYLLSNLAAGLAAMLVSGHVRAFNIPSVSMEPTLRIGDYVWAASAAYRDAAPQRGDVVVFLTPGGVDYVRRVVGLPGDRVRMRDDRIVLNGTVLPETPMGELAIREGELAVTVRRSRVALPNGTIFDIVRHSPPAAFANTAEAVVPAGSVFVLGDNLDNTIDSRSSRIGNVPLSAVEGRMALIYWSRTPHRVLSWVR